MKSFLKYLYRKIKVISPLFYYIIAYKLASRKVKRTYEQNALLKSRDELFEEFLNRCDGKKCLQIGVKDNIGKKFGPDWISVDKYDKRDFIDYNHDINNLKFKNDYFDAVVCLSILEHIPYPHKAINELYRVLKPGGEIWVQSPFLFPYHEAPKDYWRITPDGLRVWMENFTEISCGCDFWDGTSLVSATFYHGIK